MDLLESALAEQSPQELEKTGALSNIGLNPATNPLSVLSGSADPNVIDNALSQTLLSVNEIEAEVHLGKSINITGRGQNVFGNRHNDKLDASGGQGSNRLFGRRGNDHLLGNTRDQLFGQAGNDILDVSNGGGQNRLFGGQGNDQLFAGENDSLYGQGGNDIFHLGRGNNQAYGGGGRDQFILADGSLPQNPNAIWGFVPVRTS